MRKFDLLTPVGKLRMYSIHLKWLEKWMMESLLIEWGIGMSACLSIYLLYLRI